MTAHYSWDTFIVNPHYLLQRKITARKQETMPTQALLRQRFGGDRLMREEASFYPITSILATSESWGYRPRNRRIAETTAQVSFEAGALVSGEFR